MILAEKVNLNSRCRSTATYGSIMWKTLLILYALMALAVNGKTTIKLRRVCVIGAGPAGLISARHLAAHPDQFETVVFEKQSDIGGQWKYTDSITVDEHGLPVHSSVYKYLRMNGPKELLKYPDYTEIKGENVSYVKHQTTLQYLRNYTDHYNLRQYIQFDTNVEKVSPLPRMRWLIATKDLNTKKNSETECDAIMVANGHNVKGYVPNIPGIESFPGRVLHSHLYRKPEDFAGQTVVVLGAKYSGLDISIEISEYAKTIYLSHRHDKLQIELPSNIIQKAGVVAAEGGELILSDDSRIKADALVFCTGYLYHLPFLDASSGITIEEGGKYIRSLYKDLVNIERPTMAILNVPQPSIDFILPHAQVQYFVAVLLGKTKLPTRKEMLKSAEVPPGTPKSKAHYLLEKTVFYYDELVVAAGGNPSPSWFAPASFYAIAVVTEDPLHFREKNLYVYENGSFEFA